MGLIDKSMEEEATAPITNPWSEPGLNLFFEATSNPDTSSLDVLLEVLQRQLEEASEKIAAGVAKIDQALEAQRSR
jgi:hypothetical protein